MHEMSLCESLLTILEEHASSQGFSRVKTVWLEIGKLAAVENDAMRFCFDAVTRGSLAEGARLEIIEIPGQAWCRACGRTVAVAERFAQCPDCGGWQLQLTAGDEMRIKELEVE